MVGSVFSADLRDQFVGFPPLSISHFCENWAGNYFPPVEKAVVGLIF
jgi:hypothetical protein